MNKILKLIFVAVVFLAVIPGCAAAGIMALWNGIVATVCGVGTITYLQGIGLFLLGQLVSAGFVFVLLIGFWSLHGIVHNRADWRGHWHNMTDEERREFIRRRRELFGFGAGSHKGNDATEE